MPFQSHLLGTEIHLTLEIPQDNCGINSKEKNNNRKTYLEDIWSSGIFPVLYNVMKLNHYRKHIWNSSVLSWGLWFWLKGGTCGVHNTVKKKKHWCCIQTVHKDWIIPIFICSSFWKPPLEMSQLKHRFCTTLIFWKSYFFSKAKGLLKLLSKCQ